MESFAEVWDLVKQWFLDNDKLTPVVFNLWVGCAEPVELRGDTAVLSVNSPFQKNMLETRFLNLVKDGFSYVLGFDVNVEILVAKEKKEEPKEEPSDPVSTGGTEQYTFDNFIVGSSNKFAHAAALSVANNPSGNYNPLFIYGNSGLGKTHLMFAVCNKIKADNPDFNVVYVKGEAFANELIEGIKNKTTNDFHDKYRQADVFAVDDIQFIGGKERIQEEFFHTFEALYQAGKQIILTSDRPPKEIKTLEDRMRSRFEMGLTADIQPPDFETRIAIIKSKAEEIDLVISDEVCEFIATKLKSNIRQLEGVVKKIKAYQSISRTPPNISLVQNVIKDIVNDHQPIPLTVDKILDEIARTFGVSVADIKSKKRNSSVSNARQCAAYVIREVTGMSMKEIGDNLGGRDHSTVVYALQKCEKNIKENSALNSTIRDIINNIRNA